MAVQRTYLAIDLKSFYASVECVDRHLDPLTTNLVVADASRTEKTICLAVSPSLKAYKIPGRARADDEHLACVLAGKDFGDLGVKCLLFGGKLGRKWHFLADLHGDRQPAFEFHGHRGLLNL